MAEPSSPQFGSSSLVMRRKQSSREPSNLSSFGKRQSNNMTNLIRGDGKNGNDILNSDEGSMKSGR